MNHYVGNSGHPNFTLKFLAISSDEDTVLPMKLIACTFLMGEVSLRLLLVEAYFQTGQHELKQTNLLNVKDIDGNTKTKFDSHVILTVYRSGRRNE